MSRYKKFSEWATDHIGLLFMLLILGMGFKYYPGVTIMLLIFMVTIAIHEFGHCLAMLRNDIKVDEFAIGFGPLIWQRTLKNGIKVSFRAIPLGGYAKPVDDQYIAYGSGNMKVRFKVLMAGMFFNTIAATIAFAIMMWFFDYRIPEFIPGASLIPWWLAPLIFSPILNFVIWLGTPALFIIIPIWLGGGALVSGAAGPIGIVQVGANVPMDLPLSDIIEKYVFMFWILNTGVAGFNLMPIFPLDGGHLAMMPFEKFFNWRRKKLEFMFSHGIIHQPSDNHVTSLIDRYNVAVAKLDHRQALFVKYFSYVGLVLIIALTVAIIGGDIWRLITNNPIIKL